KRAWNSGSISTAPKITIRAAAAPRNNSAFKPIEKPIVETSKPTTTKERARPAASAAGPYLRSDAAAPRTIGRIGKTQGDRTVNTPATNARVTKPMPIDQSVLLRSAAIDERSVSPTERPVSRSPLNAIKVDCMRTPKALTASFWLSKSTTKKTRFLNLGSAVSSLKIGFCLAQIGHQEAWTSTKIGLPAFCAAAKASGVKVSVSVANAGETKIALAAVRATSRERRDSILESSWFVIMLFNGRS